MASPPITRVLPSDSDGAGGSHMPEARTVLLQRPVKPLPPPDWQMVKRGLPLGKAVAYCEAKGIKVNMDLMVPEQLQYA